MSNAFDETAWQTAIRKPDWYIKLYPELKRLRAHWEKDPENKDAQNIKREVRDFFEQALRESTIALADYGPNLDAQREPIDTIIIHHTGSEPGYSLSYMNAVQMLNIYVPYFNNPTISGEEGLRGHPLWSNHVRDGRPVFYVYHWLLRMNGNVDRLLHDRDLGWHAANWDINRRSVAICLDNDYEQKDPAPELLRQLGDFISQRYPRVQPERIFGHSEVSRKKTQCPGVNFVSGWKKELLKLLK
ncbi:MAG: peptidoglycan recognition family protein [Candidatus Saccharimonadales bacterium]